MGSNCTRNLETALLKNVTENCIYLHKRVENRILSYSENFTQIGWKLELKVQIPLRKLQDIEKDSNLLIRTPSAQEIN